MIYIIAVISILLGSFAQYFLKVGVSAVGKIDGSYMTAFKALMNPWFIGGVAAYGISLLFWLYVLSHMELSRAYPMVSLGYIFTLLLGWWLLGEPLSMLKCIGVVFIIIGVFFIARS